MRQYAGYLKFLINKNVKMPVQHLSEGTYHTSDFKVSFTFPLKYYFIKGLNNDIDNVIVRVEETLRNILVHSFS